jgi:hypothetical protein
MEARYDAFICYNSEDRETVRQVAARLRDTGLKCWFDEEERPEGEGFLPWIERALQNSRAVIVFYGPSGLGKFQRAEVNVAIDHQINYGRQVIPVLLSATSEPNDLPPFLRTYSLQRLANGPDDEAALGRLYCAITGHRLGEGKTVELAIRGGGNGEIDVAAEDLAKALRSGSPVTYFLGERSAEGDPDVQPLSWQLTRQLLLKLKVIQEGYDQLLPPLDIAGTYYSIRDGQDGLENTVGQYVREQSVAIAPIHRKLGRLLSLLHAWHDGESRDAVRSRGEIVRHLVVTTGLDVMLERALIAQGVPFTRIVQCRDGSRVEVTFKEVLKLPKDSVRIQYGNGALTEALSLGRSQELNTAIASPSGSTRTPPQAPLSPASCAPVIVYKYLGSEDIKDSCTISTDHLFASLRGIQVPVVLKAHIANSASLFLGCGLLDTGMRHLYYNVLREAFQVGAGADIDLRYALLSRPQVEPKDGYRRMETDLWDRMKRRAPQFKIQVLEERGDVFLDKLLGRLEAADVRAP